jgi:hypothetical protein
MVDMTRRQFVWVGGLATALSTLGVTRALASFVGGGRIEVDPRLLRDVASNEGETHILLQDGPGAFIESYDESGTLIGRADLPTGFTASSLLLADGLLLVGGSQSEFLGTREVEVGDYFALQAQDGGIEPGTQGVFRTGGVDRIDVFGRFPRIVGPLGGPDVITVPRGEEGGDVIGMYLNGTVLNAITQVYPDPTIGEAYRLVRSMFVGNERTTYQDLPITMNEGGARLLKGGGRIAFIVGDVDGQALFLDRGQGFARGEGPPVGRGVLPLGLDVGDPATVIEFDTDTGELSSWHLGREGWASSSLTEVGLEVGNGVTIHVRA